MKSNREREKKRTVRGEITAFLSLVFVLLVSFILALTDVYKRQGVEYRKYERTGRNIGIGL